jgi:hypothetical protein
MSKAEEFRQFLSNVAVDNAATISLRYGEITCALNKEFRSTESKTANSLQVGSYGRWTAIKGISDLDMLYLMPVSEWESYKSGGQYRLLRDTADAISARYPNTEVYVDRLVVRVLYKDFHVEVQPVFEEEDGSFTYPDTKNGGSWKTTRPREEISAMSEFDTQKNKNLRRLCKMARAWKNKHGVAMGGLLIDSLAYNFLKSTKSFDGTSYARYDEMSRDFFAYLADLPDQEYHAALGSRQRVRVKKRFQNKAKRAYALCQEAIAATGADAQNAKWRKVYGRGFPLRLVEVKAAAIAKYSGRTRDTEEYIEDLYPIDIRYPITIDCDVTRDGFRPASLREILRMKSPLVTRRSLRFFVRTHGVPRSYRLYWKVLNRGSEAERRDCIRGQIVADRGGSDRVESTTFNGDHVVECYAVQNGVVVAKDRIRVPISGEGQV